MAEKSLGDVLRENASKRPAFSRGRIDWELIPEGIKPRHPVAADCAAHNPGHGETCYNKPVWVIETFEGHTPTCLTHSGQVLNSLLVKYKDSSEVAMYFHPYKGE